MDYAELVKGITRYGSSTENICNQVLGISSNRIKSKVIMAPWWEPSVFSDFGEIELIAEVCSLKIWNIATDSYEISYVKTGIGAPVLTDVVLALGLTNCKKAMFIGSVGSLTEDISIGDIVLPEFSICGDGTSRYLKGSPLKANDPFGEKSFPDSRLFEELKTITKNICHENNVKYHIGQAFSIDSIFAQFAYIDEIKGMGCNVIEMETAAAFRAAKMANISLVAAFSVSDNTVVNKSLISGRTASDKKYRKEVRRTIFPKIILVRQ
jgi:purine-nucleoside phosphorylase